MKQLFVFIRMRHWKVQTKKKEDRKKVGENVPGTQFRGAHTALLALILCAYFIISSEEMLPGKEKHYMYNEFHWH